MMDEPDDGGTIILDQLKTLVEDLNDDNVVIVEPTSLHYCKT